VRPLPCATAVLLAVLAVPLGAALGVAAPASATTLVDVEPANGAVLAEPPTRLRLTFDAEPSTAVQLTLDGEPLPATLDGTVVTASLPGAAAEPGAHVVGYAVLGADGVTVRGETGWTVDPAAGSPAGPTDGRAGATDRLVSAAVLLLLGGTVVLVVRRLRARR
jgi:methionine-rich copper-binding protein CopC